MQTAQDHLKGNKYSRLFWAMSKTVLVGILTYYSITALSSDEYKQSFSEEAKYRVETLTQISKLCTEILTVGITETINFLRWPLQIDFCGNTNFRRTLTGATGLCFLQLSSISLSNMNSIVERTIGVSMVARSLFSDEFKGYAIIGRIASKFCKK